MSAPAAAPAARHLPSARRYTDAVIVAVMFALGAAAPSDFASDVAAAACATDSTAAAAVGGA